MAKNTSRVVPLKERLIGVCILSLLLVIGFLIYAKGKSYDPTRFQVDEASLSSTREAITSKQSTIVETSSFEETEDVYEDDYSEYEGTYSDIESDRSDSYVLRSNSLPNVLTPLSDLEIYNPDTLYEKINGRAPAYIGFNFQQLTCRTFTAEAIQGQYLDVFIYKMDTPVNAFGIYSLEKEANATPTDFLDQGYRSEMGFFFRWSNNYIQIIASDTSTELMALAKELSISLMTAIEADDTGVGAAAMLPIENQIAGSVSYIQSYAYGIESLNDVFEAQYEIGEVQFPFFAMKASPDEAKIAMEAIKQYFRDYGRIIQETQNGSTNLVFGESFDLYSIVYQKNEKLGGIMNAEDFDTIKAFIENHLATQTP